MTSHNYWLEGEQTLATTQSTEYSIAMEDGDTRFFESRAEARDFIEENEDQIRGRVEKRVWDHTACKKTATAGAK